MLSEKDIEAIANAAYELHRGYMTILGKETPEWDEASVKEQTDVRTLVRRALEGTLEVTCVRDQLIGTAANVLSLALHSAEADNHRKRKKR